MIVKKWKTWSLLLFIFASDISDKVKKINIHQGYTNTNLKKYGNGSHNAHYVVSIPKKFEHSKYKDIGVSIKVALGLSTLLGIAGKYVEEGSWNLKQLT